MERKLITQLKQRKNPQAYISNENIPREFVALIQKTKEFKDLSIMAIGEIYRECSLIELHASGTNDSVQITDQFQLDFIYLLKGECKMTFEVTKVFDQEQKPQILLNENFSEEQKAVMQLGMKLKAKLIKPYFNTELIDDYQVAYHKLNSNDEDPKFIKMADEFLKDPDNEPDKFQGEGWLREHQYVSNETIKNLRPNYDEYYAKVHDIVTNQLSFYPFVKLPRKVLSHMPLISTYTLKQKHKILLSFQEEILQPNQPLFREGEQLKFVYLIAEGEIRLFSTSNPFTKNYYKEKKLDENSEISLRNNSQGLGNLSKTIVENNIGKVSKGQWLGEEYILLKLPILYSAVAMSQVKVLKMPIFDFQSKFPKEVCQAMELKTIEKMDWIKSRMEKLHNIRREIAKMEPATQTYEKTVNHIKNQYPTSNSPFQQQVRKSMLEKASNNPYLLLFTSNQRLEKIRQKEEENQGISSLRTVLFNKEKMKKLQNEESTSLNYSSMSGSKTFDKRNSHSMILDPNQAKTQKLLDQSRSRNNISNNMSISRSNNKTEMLIQNQTLDQTIDSKAITQTSASLLKGKKYFKIQSKTLVDQIPKTQLSLYKELQNVERIDFKDLTISIPQITLLPSESPVLLNNQSSNICLNETLDNTPNRVSQLPYINQHNNSQLKLQSIHTQNNQQSHSSIFTKRSMSVNQKGIAQVEVSKSPLRNNFQVQNTYHMYEFIKNKVEQKKRMSNAYTLETQSYKHNNSNIKRKLVPVYNQSPFKKDYKEMNSPSSNLEQQQ